MVDPIQVLKEQLVSRLAAPEDHKPILTAALEIVEEGGSKELKKRVQQWIADIKAKEGV